MISALKLLIDVINKLQKDAKFKIYRHLFLSVIVCLLDLYLYNLISSFNNLDKSYLLFNLSSLEYLILTIIFISLARLLLLYSTVITSASIGKSIHLGHGS